MLDALERALDPLAPYIFAAIMAWYAAGFTIQTAILIARRRKNEERAGERREVKISLWTEKKWPVGGPRIDDLEGSEGQVWGEVARNGSRGSAGRSRGQPTPELMEDPPPDRIDRRGSAELVTVEEFHRKCLRVAAKLRREMDASPRR